MVTVKALRMLRPVGNRIPLPGRPGQAGLPWQAYKTEFLDSGTSSLSIALQVACSLRPEVSKPEAIFPAYACPDLVAAAVAAGVTPTLVDLLEDSPWMDEQKVKEAFGPQTVAIVAVNFLGGQAPLGQLKAIAEEGSALLIEDSAQTVPPSSGASQLADLVVLSFGRGKPVNLMGGGALLYKAQYSDAVSEQVSELTVRAVTIDTKWLLKRWLFHRLMGPALYGFMLRIPGLRLGETRYHRLETIERLSIPESLIQEGVRRFCDRAELLAAYREGLAPLAKAGWIILTESRALRIALLAPDAKTCRASLAALNAKGIGANGFYERCLPDIHGVSEYLAQSSECFPNAQSFARRLVTLPSHDDVSPRDAIRITNLLK